LPDNLNDFPCRFRVIFDQLEKPVVGPKFILALWRIFWKAMELDPSGGYLVQLIRIKGHQHLAHAAMEPDGLPNSKRQDRNRRSLSLGPRLTANEAQFADYETVAGVRLQTLDPPPVTEACHRSDPRNAS
jgi:hypothetical protein